MLELAAIGGALGAPVPFIAAVAAVSTVHKVADEKSTFADIATRGLVMGGLAAGDFGLGS